MVWGALIGAGASLLTGAMGANSASKTNAANLRTAQMNNEFNERMLDKQMTYNTDMYNRQEAYDREKMGLQNDFTREMWNSQNEYNSASEQRKRLEQAGLNPYMMMNGGSAGVAGSASGSGSGGSPSAMGVNPPTASPVTMQQDQSLPAAISSVGGIISQLLDIQAQKDVRKSQSGLNYAHTMDSNSWRDAQRRLIEADIISKNSDSTLKKYESLKSLNDWQRQIATFSSDVERSQREAENARFTGELLRAQTAVQQMQGMLTQKELQYFDQSKLSELAIMSAQQYSLVAAGKASYAQANQAIETALNLTAQREGIKLDNYTKKQMTSALIKTAKNNSAKAYYDAAEAKRHYDSFGTSSIVDGLSSVIPLGIGFGLAKLGKFKPIKVKGF